MCVSHTKFVVVVRDRRATCLDSATWYQVFLEGGGRQLLYVRIQLDFGETVSPRPCLIIDVGVSSIIHRTNRIRSSSHDVHQYCGGRNVCMCVPDL